MRMTLKEIEERDRRCAAYHVAGHVVVAAVLAKRYHGAHIAPMGAVGQLGRFWRWLRQAHIAPIMGAADLKIDEAWIGQAYDLETPSFRRKFGLAGEVAEDLKLSPLEWVRGPVYAWEMADQICGGTVELSDTDAFYVDFDPEHAEELVPAIDKNVP